MIKILLFIIIMGALIGFLWQDEMKSWVASWQKKVEEQGPDWAEKSRETTVNFLDDASVKWVDGFVAKLTVQGKTKIDKWLETKNLNQFGDKLETKYAVSTPLFNQATGQTIDRYVYLLKKFPDLVRELKLEQYLKQ